MFVEQIAVLGRFDVVLLAVGSPATSEAKRRRISPVGRVFSDSTELDQSSVDRSADRLSRRCQVGDPKTLEAGWPVEMFSEH